MDEVAHFFLVLFITSGKVDILNRSDASPSRLAALHAYMSDYKILGFLVSISCVTLKVECHSLYNMVQMC